MVVGRAVLSGLFQSLSVLFYPLRQMLTSRIKFAEPKVRRRLLAGVSVIVIAILVMIFWWPQLSGAQKVNSDVSVGLGEVVADETARLLGDRGEVVLLVFDSAGQNLPAVEATLRAFRGGLKSHPRLYIQATELIKAVGNTAPLSAEQFCGFLGQYASADAIITFVGLPELADLDWRKLPQRRPRVVVAGGFSPELQQFLERDVVQVAMVPDFKPGDKAPRTAREWFDRYFTIVTPTNPAASATNRRK